MSTGTTVQVIGAVVDVQFPAGQIPKVYDALLIDDVDLTLEVQQQLGDGVVRTIAMGSSEGLKRGMAVTNTGQAISVPVGEKTLHWAVSWTYSASLSITRAKLALKS
jgi:F-type H+-transporting ATPase subunit beta